MSPISARSRSPACVETSMLSISARASAGSSTGICPEIMTCRGPRTVCAGLAGMTWPLTSQSNRWRSAASRCLTEGCGQLARRRLELARELKDAGFDFEADKVLA